MKLYVTAKTDISDVYVDYISIRLNTGEEVSLNWDGYLPRGKAPSAG